MPDKKRPAGIRDELSAAKWYMKKVYALQDAPSVRQINKYRPEKADHSRIQYYLRANAAPGTTNPDTNMMEELTVRDQSKMLATKSLLAAALEDGEINTGYLAPFLMMYERLPVKYEDVRFLLKWGDNGRDLPGRGWIAKTRLADAQNVTLLKLKPNRHFSQLENIAEQDRPFREKIDKAVWRGKPTGLKPNPERDRSFRYQLVRKDRESPLFDFGFSDLMGRDFSSSKLQDAETFVKGRLSVGEQLAHKILISVEGNDVASGLKWMMASNSVVVMSEPTVCSWFMEDTLQPWVHYVQTKHDFSDLETQVRWCLEHEDECLKIIENAQNHVAQFLDPVREIYIEREVFRRHLDASGDWTQVRFDPIRYARTALQKWVRRRTNRRLPGLF